MYNSKSAAAEAASSDADRKHAMKVLRELLARPDMADADDRGIYERILERYETAALLRTTRYLN